MTARQKSSAYCIHQGERQWWNLCIVLLVLCNADLILKGLFVNGQNIVQPNEAKSSPSHIIVMKRSSVWLHWNYTYLGDGTHGAVASTFKDEVIGFNGSSYSIVQALAKRIGQNGALTLQSPTPAPFDGRVNVISSNSTLVIHNLQYNDSLYQFSSTVNVDVLIASTTAPTPIHVKPTVSFTINGIPEFMPQPPSTLEVNEGSNLVMRIEMDGNPKPSASFKWMHLDGTLPISFPTVQLYPFVYSSTYSSPSNIGASYCGRALQSIIQNSFGFKTFQTNVTVLLKLDKGFGLKSGKLGVDNCIEVKWNKAESGACFVKYDVTFKNASGYDLHSETGYNIGGMSICKLAAYANITDVQLIASFRSTSKTLTAKVAETPTTTLPPTTETTASKSATKDDTTQTLSTGITSTMNTCACKETKASSSDEWNTRDSAYIAVIAILVIIIVIMSIIMLNLWRKSTSGTKPAEPGPKSQPDVMHYMDLQIRSNETDSNYAKLQGDYEEVGKSNPEYVNA